MWERNKKSCLLTHFPSGYSIQGCFSLKPGAWHSGVQVHGSSSVCIPRCISGDLDWKQSSRGLNLCPDMECHYYWWWLNPLCHNGDPELFPVQIYSMIFCFFIFQLVAETVWFCCGLFKHISCAPGQPSCIYLYCFLEIWPMWYIINSALLHTHCAAQIPRPWNKSKRLGSKGRKGSKIALSRIQLALRQSK